MYEEIKVKGGQIIAQESGDTEYPGIWVEFLKKGDNGQYCSRPAIKMEYDPSIKQVRLLVWADPDSEDYTHEFTFDKYYKKK